MGVVDGLTDSRWFVVEGAAGAPICAAFGGGGGGMVKDREKVPLYRIKTRLILLVLWFWKWKSIIDH